MAKLVRQLNTEHVLIDSATAPLLARMRASLSAALGRPIEDGDPEDFLARVLASLERLAQHDFQPDGITARYAVA